VATKADPWGGKPGVNWKQVSPENRKKLNGLIEHYRKMPRPFTSCVRDNTKRFGPDGAKRVCAVLKDLMHGGTDWRGERKHGEHEPDYLTHEELAAVIEQAEAIMGERKFFDPAQLRVAAGGAGGGRWTRGGDNTPTREATVRWAGKQMNRKQLLAQLKADGVPQDAWAWRHKAAARKLGIPVPTKQPAAKIRKVEKISDRIATNKTKRRKASAKAATATPRKAAPRAGSLMYEEREFFDAPAMLSGMSTEAKRLRVSKQLRAPKGTAIGGRWIKILQAADAQKKGPGSNEITVAGNDRVEADRLAEFGNLKKKVEVIPATFQGGLPGGIPLSRPRAIETYEITPKGQKVLASARADRKMFRSGPDEGPPRTRTTPSTPADRQRRRAAVKSAAAKPPRADQALVDAKVASRTPLGDLFATTARTPENRELLDRLGSAISPKPRRVSHESLVRAKTTAAARRVKPQKKSAASKPSPRTSGPWDDYPARGRSSPSSPRASGAAGQTPAEVDAAARVVAFGPDEAKDSAVRTLRDRWASLSVELQNFIGRPDAPEAKAIIEEQKAITKIVHHHYRDTGAPTDLGRPGLPHDVVVVGGGPGGLAAAIYGATEGLDTLLVSAQPEPGGQIRMSSRVENVPGFPAGVVGQEYARDSLEQAQRLGAYTELGVRVTAMSHDPETDLKTLQFSDGRSVTARSVVIAGGVEPRQLDVPGFENNPSVVYGDSREIRARAAGEPVAFIGGGNSAAQAALDVAGTGSKVTILLRSGGLSKSMSSYLIRQLESHPNISVRSGSVVVECIRGADGSVEAVRLADGTVIPCKAVGVFIGSAPDTDWAGVVVDERGFIVTGESGGAFLETSVPGVFAAGDVRSGTLKRVVTATSEGATAVSSSHVYLEQRASGYRASQNVNPDQLAIPVPA
jgi:thioredoxin reductase